MDMDNSLKNSASPTSALYPINTSQEIIDNDVILAIDNKNETDKCINVEDIYPISLQITKPIPINSRSYLTELLNNQDFTQKISIIPIFLVELYRVMVSSFLILFVPQKCGNHTCQLNENLVLDSSLYNAGLVFNFITTFFFVILYIIEIKRENRLITYLHVSSSVPSDNASVGKMLEKLPIEKKNNILYLDKAYQKIGYFVMLLFAINSVLSGVVVFNYYLDNQTTTTYITNIILMITKLSDIYTTAHTDKNIFYSSYLKGRIQFNDVDPDKKVLEIEEEKSNL
jgi:hypothetical protein